MKTCNKCKLKLPESDFSKRQAACKGCCRAKNKLYYAENREKISAQNKVYREENRAEIAAWRKNYYVENREKLAAINKINYAENREERAAYSKEYRAENKEKIAAQGRLYRHGVTPDDFKRIFANQGGVCAICGGLGGKKGLCVDHDHETGKVRGLLCASCNRGIGFFKDSSSVAQLAVNYLKTNGK